ncbi:hypothetical protein [Terricaulis sp.]|uniref:hypothetical protein n=1 Tax=Terricaulis sp. TaxID=2768686 RepID=UPI0037848CE7
MNALVDFLFGARPRVAHQGEARIVLDKPPRHVQWRKVQVRPDHEPIRAWRAEADRDVETDHGMLHARGGHDMIVAYGPQDYGVIRREIFDRMYVALGGGLYRKREDVILRYFICERPCSVVTLEGAQDAEPGDWIMQGVTGELWPVRPEKAERKYRHV